MPSPAFWGWLDSIPMLVISGQVRYDTTVCSTGLPLRQLGDQEFDIIRVVAPMTKYAVMVTDPREIRYHMERALYLAHAGRPGPCWLDVPINVQGAQIDEQMLRSYRPEEDARQVPPPVKKETLNEIIGRLRSAKRPALLAGSAIRSSGAHKEFLELVELLRIPVLTAWNAHDCIPDENRYYMGRPGSLGDRPGNFVQQNSDLLLSLGCRLSLRQTSFHWKAFARGAFKIVIEIDPLELLKPTIQPDLPIHGNVAHWIRALKEELSPEGLPIKEEWLSWCRERKKRYPVVLEEYWKRKERVNPYCFIEALNRQLPEGQITVSGNGSACVCLFQAGVVKKGQRMYTNSGSATMGYDLPGAIGACIASGRKKIVCLAGDGSIQMNLQELQTVVHHQLPIKIFVLNNQGYHSMRQTLGNFYGSIKVGFDPESGVSFPSMERVAYAYGIPYFRCAGHDQLESCISSTLKGNSPSICELVLTIDQPFAPKQSSQSLPDGRIVSKPLEDLAPFLDREEFRGNMIIDPLPE